MLDRRRLLVLTLAGTAGLLAARAGFAQAVEDVPRIAIVAEIVTVAELRDALSAADPQSRARLWSAYFFPELARRGLISGETATFDFYDDQAVRDAGGPEAFLPMLLATQPDVIVMTAWWLTPALLAISQDIPVVTYAPDPVALGVTGNMARPDRNVTGFNLGVGIPLLAKQVQLLSEFTGDPRVGVVMGRPVLEIPGMAESPAAVAALATLGIEVVIVPVDPLPSPTAAAQELWLRSTIAVIKAQNLKTAVLIDIGDFDVNYGVTARLMLEAGLATMTGGSGISYARFGGLLGYGANPAEVMQVAAEYTAEIIDGVAPADLPFQHPRSFLFGINTATAEALGLSIPAHLRVQATDIFP